ncbi:hypothetical protein GP486_007794, partial [Trichoglossum hirsutum]
MPSPLQGPRSVCSDASASPHRHRNHHHHRKAPDRSHLAPEDAFVASPARWHQQEQHQQEQQQQQHHEIAHAINGVDKPGSSRAVTRSRRRRDRDRGRSGSRRRMKAWKKLLWVKQSYPDNYTDEETFLSQLQRNPRFQPYDFWPLVADSTVIVQHVCSVIIFACCFVGIHQGRVSPVSVVSWGSLGTVLGWVMLDWWVGKEEAAGGGGGGEAGSSGSGSSSGSNGEGGGESGSSASSTTGSVVMSHGTQASKDMNGVQGLGLKFPTSSTATTNTTATTTPPQRPNHSHSTSATSVHSNASLSSSSSPVAVAASPSSPHHGNGGGGAANNNAGHQHGFFLFHSQQQHNQHQQQHGGTSSSTWIFSPRNQQRLATAKSAILIYYALLGLSPILKSLTRSTTSDSIWAMSAWLMCINVFFFDYGGDV